MNILAEGISVLDNRAADKRGVTLLKMPKNSVISDGRQEIGMAPDTTLNLNDSVMLPSLDSEFSDGKGYPVTNMTLSEKDSDVSGSEPTVTNDTTFAIISEMEGHLGMTVHQALALWQSAGAPVIYLSQGVNCLDLGKLLSRTDVSAEHLEALKIWLQEHKAGGQGK